MSQVLNLKVKGLHTNMNQLSEAPEGALAVADNVVIDKDGVIEPRRGFSLENDYSSLDTSEITSLTSFQDTIVAHREDNVIMADQSVGGWTEYAGTTSRSYGVNGDLTPFMKFEQMNSNLYISNDDQVKAVYAVDDAVEYTGVPKALDIDASLTGSSGFLANDTQVAYRVVWGVKDVHGNLYLGVPSQRVTIANTAGASRDVSLVFTVPEGITTDHFYQIYRSNQSSSATTEANDELQLVYEDTYVSGSTITLTDSTPDSLKGAFLYSNANQEGIAQTNNPPPQAHDIAVFKNHMFFANVVGREGIFINLVAVDGSGLVVDDTITIAAAGGISTTFVYTAKTSENIGSAQFKVFTSGSVSQNIEDTAKSFIKVFNRHSGNQDLYAYYISGYNDLPGKIYIENRAVNLGTITVNVNNAVAWDIGSGESVREARPNGLMWSKEGQPEHVPLVNSTVVGSKNYPIKRILPLKDSLFIFKDDGIFRLTGNFGEWVIEEYDKSAKLVGMDSLAVLNNQLFGLFDQGVCTVSDLGVAIISRPIEDLIYTESAEAVGVGYESDRKYILYTKDADDFQFALVYNTFTRAWTKWTRNQQVKAAIIDPVENKLVTALAGKTGLTVERKNASDGDFFDELRFTRTRVSVSGDVVTLNSVAGITVGDGIGDGDGNVVPIVEIDEIANTVTTATDVPNVPSTVSIYAAIECTIEWVNQTAGNPGVDKHWREAAVLFRTQNFKSATVEFYTDISGGYEEVPITGLYGGGTWGTFTWGSVPWGGQLMPRPVRALIPREKSRGTILGVRFTIREANARWSVNGVSIMFNTVSERTNRS